MNIYALKLSTPSFRPKFTVFVGSSGPVSWYISSHDPALEDTAQVTEVRPRRFAGIDLLLEFKVGIESSAGSADACSPPGEI